MDLDDPGDGVAFDELAFSACGFAESGGGEAVGVAHAAEGSLVEHGDGVGRKDLEQGLLSGGGKGVFSTRYLGDELRHRRKAPI